MAKDQSIPPPSPKWHARRGREVMSRREAEPARGQGWVLGRDSGCET